ncbi:hypothetical protein [Streptomyces sp. NPDC001020]
MEAQTAPERGTKESDLVGATQHLGSCQQVRFVIWLIVLREQYGYGRIRDIALVDNGCASHVRARHHVARPQLRRPASGVGVMGRVLSSQHRARTLGSLRPVAASASGSAQPPSTI